MLSTWDVIQILFLLAGMAGIAGYIARPSPRSITFKTSPTLKAIMENDHTKKQLLKILERNKIDGEKIKIKWDRDSKPIDVKYN